MKLYNFMQIDTCPICGNETWPVENGYLGVKQVVEMPADVTFRIVCKDKDDNLTCGEFRITRKDQSSLTDDWVATYIPVDFAMMFGET